MICFIKSMQGIKIKQVNIQEPQQSIKSIIKLIHFFFSTFNSNQTNKTQNDLFHEGGVDYFLRGVWVEGKLSQKHVDGN